MKQSTLFLFATREPGDVQATAILSQVGQEDLMHLNQVRQNPLEFPPPLMCNPVGPDWSCCELRVEAKIGYRSRVTLTSPCTRRAKRQSTRSFTLGVYEIGIPNDNLVVNRVFALLFIDLL